MEPKEQANACHLQLKTGKDSTKRTEQGKEKSIIKDADIS